MSLNCHISVLSDDNLADLLRALQLDEHFAWRLVCKSFNRVYKKCVGSVPTRTSIRAYDTPCGIRWMLEMGKSFDKEIQFLCALHMQFDLFESHIRDCQGAQERKDAHIEYVYALLAVIAHSGAEALLAPCQTQMQVLGMREVAALRVIEACPRSIAYFHIVKNSFEVSFTEGACLAAARGGHESVLLLAKEMWSEAVFSAAAGAGRTDMMALLVQQECPRSLTNAMLHAIQNGQVNVVYWLFDAGIDVEGYNFRDDIAAANNVTMMRIFLERGHPWDANSMCIAAENGNTEVFLYMCEEGLPLGFCTEDDIDSAVRRGVLEGKAKEIFVPARQKGLVSQKELIYLRHRSLIEDSA